MDVHLSTSSNLDYAPPHHHLPITLQIDPPIHRSGRGGGFHHPAAATLSPACFAFLPSEETHTHTRSPPSGSASPTPGLEQQPGHHHGGVRGGGDGGVKRLIPAESSTCEEKSQRHLKLTLTGDPPLLPQGTIALLQSYNKA